FESRIFPLLRRKLGRNILFLFFLPVRIFPSLIEKNTIKKRDQSPEKSLEKNRRKKGRKAFVDSCDREDPSSFLFLLSLLSLLCLPLNSLRRPGTIAADGCRCRLFFRCSFVEPLFPPK